MEEAGNVECGFCLRKIDDSEEPKVLPCRHVHCFGCLRDSYELNHVVQCPLPECSKVHHLPVDSLPDSTHQTFTSFFCDVCTRKGLDDQPFTIYCKTCVKKFCERHQQEHDDIHEEHSTVDISEYKTEAGKLEAQFCKIHPEETYLLGCKVCQDIFCLACSENIQLCTTGEPHVLLPAGKLMVALKEEMEKSKSALASKEEDIEKYFKRISRESAEFDEETEEMLRLLRKTRDEQVEAIKKRYALLECELVKKRQKTKAQIDDFLELILGTKWNDFRNNRLRICARMENPNEYVLLKRYADTIAEMESLVATVSMPAMEISNVVQVQGKGEKRTTELEIVAASDIVVTTELMTNPQAPANSLVLHGSTKVAGKPNSAFLANGITNITWSETTLLATYAKYQHNMLIRLQKRAVCCVVEQNHLCMLNNDRSVSVCDLKGSVIREWLLDDSIYAHSQIAVVSNKIVPSNGRCYLHLHTYSLTGTLLEQFSIIGFGDLNESSISGLPDNAVVISHFTKSKVVKIDIETRQVVWMRTGIPEPQGVTFDGNKCVYVYSRSTCRIYILSVVTGAVLGSVHDDRLGTSKESVYSLHISGNTLVVPQYNKRRVLYYELKKF